MAYETQTKNVIIHMYIKFYLSSVEHDMVRCLHLSVGQGAVSPSSMLFSSITTLTSSSFSWVLSLSLA